VGTFLTRYGEAGYAHEGFAWHVLDDGSLCGSWGPDTRARMIGQRVAGCDCGWTGITRYPCADGDPDDETAQERALAEWEHHHARPVLAQAQHDDLDRLARLLRDVGAGVELTATANRRELAEQLHHALHHLAGATELADRLHQQISEQIDTEQP